MTTQTLEHFDVLDANLLAKVQVAIGNVRQEFWVVWCMALLQGQEQEQL